MIDSCTSTTVNDRPVSKVFLQQTRSGEVDTETFFYALKSTPRLTARIVRSVHNEGITEMREIVHWTPGGPQPPDRTTLAADDSSHQPATTDRRATR